MSLVCKCIPMSVRALEEYPGDPGRYWRNPGNLRFPGDTLGIQGILLVSGGHCNYPEDPGIRVFLSIDGDPFFKNFSAFPVYYIYYVLLSKALHVYT